MGELSIIAAQLQELSRSQSSGVAYLQCLLSSLGSECGEWLSALERAAPSQGVTAVAM
ncbi:hypothetical protein HZU77_001830 [Neisseriaceae bacterium TC5R-5]|nr:hypothetical protein [Neisseriaceae bacterium TC5R-5]